jgi:hypothetical protein
LYYTTDVDPTVLIPLNEITTEQTKATGKIHAATNQLLDYLATHQDATIRDHASDMILQIHSDASVACSFAATNLHKRKPSMAPSSIWHQSSKMWSPQRLNQK